MKRSPVPKTPDEFTTIEVAQQLGMSVRSVQMMVDRGDLQAWKTPGGHRRISRTSLERWRDSRGGATATATAITVAAAAPQAVRGPSAAAMARTASPLPKARVLLIDDSLHFQKLVALLMQRHFPNVDLQVADDGIAGLALYGQLKPDVLVVDILLPGIDGATLITSLRSHPQFAASRLAVVTSLAESERAPYAFALENVPVIHKPRLVAELPRLLGKWLPSKATARAGTARAS
jgi:excisionase family DNA binding protein